MSGKHARERVSRALHRTASVSLIGLIALTLAWELWLAPLRPGGSWLALKVLPLILPLSGVLRGRTYTYGWAMMLVLAYFAEGTVRAYTERGTSALLAALEIVLALTFFVTSIAYVRARRTIER